MVQTDDLYNLSPTEATTTYISRKISDIYKNMNRQGKIGIATTILGYGMIVGGISYARNHPVESSTNSEGRQVAMAKTPEEKKTEKISLGLVGGGTLAIILGMYSMASGYKSKED